MILDYDYIDPNINAFTKVTSAACKSTPAETALMSKTSHECGNIFVAVFAHYLLSFDVQNKVLNRSHESHHCTMSAQAQLGKGKPYRSRKELNTPHVNRLQCINRNQQGDCHYYEWFDPKELTVIRNGQVIVMDR